MNSSLRAFSFLLSLLTLLPPSTSYLFPMLVAMNALTIYGIVAGGTFAVFCTVKVATSFITWVKLLDVLIDRHLSLPFLLRRHRQFGPWSRGNVLLCLSYIAVNIFLVVFGDTSSTNTFRRAGTLSMINSAFLLSSTSLSYLSDVLGVTLRNCQRVHRAVGWTSVSLQAFHIIGMTLVSQVHFPIRKPGNFAAILVRLATILADHC